MKNIQLEHRHHDPSLKKYPISFLAHNINSPMNIGSLFRVADMMGVEKIYFSGSSLIPPNSKIRKTSRSTEKYVSFSYILDPFAVIELLKADGYKIISLEITSASTDIKELPIKKSEKVCLILGSENVGISQDLLDISDETVHIPMLGFSSSMNVAIACSLATFEITKKLTHKEGFEMHQSNMKKVDALTFDR